MASSSSDYRKQDLIFLLCTAGVFCLNLYKAHLGMGSNDEQFYTTLGYRLYQGDALFYDDWHIAQMISVFIAPFVSLFIKITGSTDGILHYMRIVYAVFSAVVGCSFYLHFRRKRYAAAAGAVAYMLFTPYSIMALSYNTMSVGFLILALSCWPDDEDRLRLYFSGLFYAWAVLNTPYLAVIFLILTIVTIMKPERFSHRKWLWAMVGIATAAAAFLLIVFSRESFSQFMEGIPHLIDPSHSDSILLLIVKNGGRLLIVYTVFIPVFAAELFLAYRWRKQLEKHGKLIHISFWINLVSMVYSCFVVPNKPDLGGWAVILIPFAVNGLIFLILNRLDREERIWFLVSFMHSFLLAISSNVGPSAFSGPLITADAVLVMHLLSEDTRIDDKIPVYGFLALLLFFKAGNVYLPPDDYSTRLKDGPLAGLYDTEEHARSYEKTLKDLETINAMPEEHAVLLTWDSWEYLALRKRISTNSTYLYFWEEGQYIAAQKEYADMHPDKLPMYVYLDTASPAYGMQEDDPWLQQFSLVEPMENGILYLRKE